MHYSNFYQTNDESFVDADGCVSILTRAYGIAVSQKYRAVLDAFHERFGGQEPRWVAHSNSPIGGCWVWQKVAGTKECVADLLPYSFEKRDQMKLLLECDNRNRDLYRSKMNALKGRRKVDYAAFASGRKLKDADESEDRLSEEALEELLETCS